MSSRKKNIFIIAVLMIISLNSLALTHAIAPPGINDGGFGSSDPSLLGPATSNEEELQPVYHAGSYPNLSKWDLNMNATRFIKALELGVITINDTYTIINNDNITLPVFRFAFPNNWAEELLSITGRSNWANVSPLNVSTVEVEYTDETFTYYKMNLNPAISNSSKYYITVFTTFGIVYETFETKDSNNLFVNGIRYNISRTPLVSMPIQKCRTNFLMNEDGEVITDLVYPTNASSSTGNINYGEVTNVPAFNFSEPYDANSADYPYRVQVAYFQRVKPPAMATSYKRTITLDNWYWAKIQDTITVECFGILPEGMEWNLVNPIVFSSGLVELNLGVDNPVNGRVYDILGEFEPVGTDKQIFTDSAINIYFRIPLMGGKSATFNVEYYIPLERVLDFEKNEFILKMDALPETDLAIKDFELSFILPQGARYQYLYFGNQDTALTTGSTNAFLFLGRKDTVSFTATNIGPNDNIRIRLGYAMSDFAYFIQPLTFSLVFFIAFLVYIGISTLQKDIIEKVIISPEGKKEIPYELIQDFVEQYEEKTALQSRITKLDEDRRKKKIKVKEYDQQRRILESKMRDVIQSLDDTKRELKNKGRKYADAINKIEISEEKRINIARSIRELRLRYIREKTISKDAYLRILRDYQDQIEKFERTIDREIINLRLLLEHEKSAQ